MSKQNDSAGEEKRSPSQSKDEHPPAPAARDSSGFSAKDDPEVQTFIFNYPSLDQDGLDPSDLGQVED